MEQQPAAGLGKANTSGDALDGKPAAASSLVNMNRATDEESKDDDVATNNEDDNSIEEGKNADFGGIPALKGGQNAA